MKTIKITIAAFLILATGSGKASIIENGYEEAMKSHIKQLFEYGSFEQMQKVVNGFERIAEAEKDKWLPRYYAAYGYIIMSTKVEDPARKDELLDQSLQHIKSSFEMVPDESELHALEGFVHMMRVAVDPASRGAQYSGLSFQSFQKALELNPGNPRALYLMARMQMGTAQFFGNDTTDACNMVNQSIALFESQPKESGLMPVWGLNQALQMKKGCKGD